jgi:hypothetical protein
MAKVVKYKCKVLMEDECLSLFLPTLFISSFFPVFCFSSSLCSSFTKKTREKVCIRKTPPYLLLCFCSCKTTLEPLNVYSWNFILENFTHVIGTSEFWFTIWQ